MHIINLLILASTLNLHHNSPRESVYSNTIRHDAEKSAVRHEINPQNNTLRVEDEDLICIDLEDPVPKLATSKK